MTTVETPEDASAATSTTPPPGRSWRAALASTEIDTRLLGMVIAARRDLDRLPHPVGRGLPDRPQPVEPLGPEHLHRHHGDGDGAHHRVAQHRPVGRLAARLPRLHDGARPDRRDLRVLRPRRDRRRPAGQGLRLGRRARLRPPARAPSSAPRRGSSSPTSGSLRSSSPWAASSSGAASSSAWATSRARRSLRSTRRSSCSAAGRRGRSASGGAGCVALLACAAHRAEPRPRPPAPPALRARACARCGPRSGWASSAARP